MDALCEICEITHLLRLPNKRRQLKMANTDGRLLGDLLPNPNPAPYPERVVLEGRHVVLDPLSTSHADDLFSVLCGEQNTWLWDYLGVGPFTKIEDFRQSIAKYAQSKDPVFWAITVKPNRNTETCSDTTTVGFISLMRIAPENRSIEVGYLVFSPRLQRSTAATEAVYLLGRYAFQDLGYRRFEWKCNTLNEASRRAALRFGFTFEGVFRQHMIVKGRNRDTAWFSILDSEWETKARQAFEHWLADENFDGDGRQKKRLEEFRK